MRVDKERLYSLRKKSEYDNAASDYIFTPISRAFSLLLVRTPFTPNQITVFWGLLMIFSSIALFFGNWYLNVLAGIGWIVAYALDFTDGDIARYKNITSNRGKYQDLVNHRATYPLLMFGAGFGAYSVGRTEFLGIQIEPVAYLVLGFLAGIGMIMIMDLGDIYNRSNPSDALESDFGSAAVEGKNVKNKKLFKFIMNINPLTFNNMMILILVCALLDIMDLFVIFYGIFYPLAAFFRYILLYRSIPARKNSN